MQRDYDSGFILMEVVVALLLMGVLLHGGSRILSHLHQQKCQRETHARQQSILKTLASYAAINGRLPWAAGKEGVENRATRQRFGYVPFKTLGLSVLYGKDGYGRFMRYHVASFHAPPPSVSPLERYCRAAPENPLRHVHYDAALASDCIAVSLISHGPEVCDCSEERLDVLEGLPGHTVVWATRNTLLTLYGEGSCASFHQPLPTPGGGGTRMRGFGR